MVSEKKKEEAKKKRENLRGLAKRIASMTEADRAVLASRMGGVTTIEGHALSLRNQCLVAMQAEEASVVGGFRQWIKAGRVVEKGQKGIGIRVPCSPGGNAEIEDDEEQEDGSKKRMRFTFGTVFDISQTKELTEEEKAKIKSRGKGKRKAYAPAPKAKPAPKPKATRSKYQPTENVESEFDRLFG
jgi:hypothetical protein